MDLRRDTVIHPEEPLLVGTRVNILELFVTVC